MQVDLESKFVAKKHSNYNSIYSDTSSYVYHKELEYLTASCIR